MVKVGDTVSWNRHVRSGFFGVRRRLTTGTVVRVFPKGHLLQNHVRVRVPDLKRKFVVPIKDLKENPDAAK